MIADTGVDRLAAGGKNRGDVAAAAGKIFVKVPAPRLQRALAGGQLVDARGFGPFNGRTDRTGRAFAARPAELPLCSSLFTRCHSQRPPLLPTPSPRPLHHPQPTP